jgi:mono/diheme cytochrome c family protein
MRFRAVFVAAVLLVSASARAQDADAGRSVYVAKCLACHGDEGKGDGPAAAALPKRPPDMTTPSFWNAMTDERLRSVVTNGKPNGVMRPFPMKEQQLTNLVAYLRTMEPK